MVENESRRMDQERLNDEDMPKNGKSNDLGKTPRKGSADLKNKKDRKDQKQNGGRKS